ncbi:MAG TPA: hypothetical protein VKZ18_23680 [Polyangia bacterium]|nr:hypothetical protein [Polyangia bacterium]
MQERRHVRAVNAALKAAVIAGFVGFGACIVGLVAKFSSRPEIFEPYPLFGASLAWLHWVVAVIYAGLWLTWMVVMLRAVPGDQGTAGLVVGGFVGLLMLVAGVGAAYGLNCANALLDFSAPVRTPVLVRKVRSESGKTIRGATSLVMATVSPLDRPDQQVDLDWRSCDVTSPAVVSPFASIRVGRGAFGAPWIALPVDCRALAAGDRPLFDTFRLGSGPAIVATVDKGESASVRAMRAERRSELLQTFDGFINGSTGSRRGQAEAALSDAELTLSAAGRAELENALRPLLIGDVPGKAKDVGREAIRIVNEDLRRQDPAYLLSLWKQGIDAAATNVPMAVIRGGDGAGVLAGFQLPGCSIVSEDTVDMAIYRAFTGRTGPGLGGNQVFLADRSGHLAFKAALSDTSSLPALVRQLRLVTPQR